MYGLLLQNMSEYIIKVFGDKKWIEIRDSLKITQVRKINFRIFFNIAFFMDDPNFSLLGWFRRNRQFSRRPAHQDGKEIFTGKN